MFCPNCGIGNRVDQKFCRGCGHSLAAHKIALENNFEEAVEKIKTGATAVGVSICCLVGISLMALSVWLLQNDAGVFFTLVPVLAFVIPAVIFGLVRLNRGYRALSATDRGNKAVGKSQTAVHLGSAATTYPLAEAAQVPASVTEHTTLNLDSPARVSDESRTSRQVDSPSSTS